MVVIVAKLLLIAGLLFSAVVQAELQLKPDHPKTYVVQEGDTLWGIAGQYLDDPWQWEELWELNEAVENPHLIYPGDRIVLVYVDGQPRLRIEKRGRPTIKLSPKVRPKNLTRSVPTISPNAMRRFGRLPRIVSAEELAAAPHVLAFDAEHVIVSRGDRIYARAPEEITTRRFSIYRDDGVLTDPVSGEALGLQAIHLGDADLVRSGDPMTLVITRSKQEILLNDRLLPAESDDSWSFVPSRPDKDLRGLIIKVLDGVSLVSRYQVVALNLGSRDGLERGSVLAAFASGREAFDPALEGKREFVWGGFSEIGDLPVQTIRAWDDEGSRVILPEEEAGLLLVFRVFERVGYAVVMEANRVIRVGDMVGPP